MKTTTALLALATSAMAVMPVPNDGETVKVVVNTRGVNYTRGPAPARKENAVIDGSCKVLGNSFKMAYNACARHAATAEAAVDEVAGSVLRNHFGSDSPETRKYVKQTLANIGQECSNQDRGYLKISCPLDGECESNPYLLYNVNLRDFTLDMEFCPMFFSVADFEFEELCPLDRYDLNQGSYLLFYAAMVPQVNPKFGGSQYKEFTPQGFFDFAKSFIKYCGQK